MQAVTLLATIPAILAIVNFLKGQGLKSNLAIVAAVVLGVVLNVADYYLAASGSYQAAAQGLILGLGAAGLYDVTAPKYQADTVLEPCCSVGTFGR